jgi:hypothetical protein
MYSRHFIGLKQSFYGARKGIQNIPKPLAFHPSFVLTYLVSFGNGRWKFISDRFFPSSDRVGIHNASETADGHLDPYPFLFSGIILSEGRVAPD